MNWDLMPKYIRVVPVLCGRTTLRRSFLPRIRSNKQYNATQTSSRDVPSRVRVIRHYSDAAIDTRPSIKHISF